MPSQRSGSGSHRRERWPTQSSRVRSVSLPGDEVGQRPAGQVGRGHAVADVAARPGQALLAGPTPRSTSSPGRRRAGRPTRWVTAAPPMAGNRPRSVRAMASCVARVVVELGLHGRAEVVRRAPPAEGEAPVRRPLPVDDQVAGVVEGLPVAQPDLVPRGVGQRLGGDHERVERHQRPALAVERGGVALGGPDDDVGLERCPGRCARGPVRWRSPGWPRGGRRRGAPPRSPTRGPAGPGGSPRSGACSSAPRTPAARSRSAASARSSQRRSSSPRPNRRASSSSSRSRPVWAGLVARWR